MAALTIPFQAVLVLTVVSLIGYLVFEQWIERRFNGDDE